MFGKLKAAVELVCDFDRREARFAIDVLPSGVYFRSKRQSNVTVLDGSSHNYTQHHAGRGEVADEDFVEAAFRVVGLAFTPSQLARGHEKLAFFKPRRADISQGGVTRGSEVFDPYR